jgi:hypothetical protein
MRKAALSDEAAPDKAELTGMIDGARAAFQTLRDLKERIETLRKCLEARRHDPTPADDPSLHPWLASAILQLHDLMNFSVGCGVPPPTLAPLIQLMAELSQIEDGRGSARLGVPPPGKTAQNSNVAKKAAAAAAVTKLMEGNATEAAALNQVVRRLWSTHRLTAGALKSYRKKVMATRPRRDPKRRARASAAECFRYLAAEIYRVQLGEVKDFPPNDGAEIILKALLLLS